MIHYSSSFYDFLRKSDNKVAKCLCNAYDYKYKAYDLMITANELNYLTFRNDGTISFLPYGKQHLVNDDGTWKKENRQNGKPAKVIRKLFTEKALTLFKQSDFETFGNEYKAKFCIGGLEFKLLENKEIPNVYEMDRTEGGGTLNGSCMNGDSEYLDIYKYCAQLQILILVNKEGLLCGRSLVWKISDDITLMDRIYVNEDHLYDAFLDYAKSKNWWRKEYYKTYDNKRSFIDNKGEKVTKTFTIDTDTDHDSYPYIDTFSYGEDGSLNNCSGTYTYNKTDGKREGDEDEHEDEVWDEINGEYISDDDSALIERGRYRDCYTHINYTVCINDEYWWEGDKDIVQVNGTWYTKDDDEIVYIESEDEYYERDECTYCERDGQYYLSDDCVYSEYHEEDFLRDEAVRANDGNWYHQDDKDELLININGTWYNKEDDSDIEEIDGEFQLKQTQTLENEY